MNPTGPITHYPRTPDEPNETGLKRIIRGQLTPVNSEAIGQNPRLLSAALRAFRDNGLKELTTLSFEWDGKKLAFNNISSIAVVQEGVSPVEDFIEKLYRVIQTDEVAGLELTGGFTFVFETPTYPQVTRVMVSNGRIAYQESEYLWASTAVKVKPPKTKN